MERDKMLENFINNWNGEFPNYELKPADLKEPQALMGALMQVFDRLGIDRSLLAESPEDNVNDSVPYYRDLLPVINVTRVVNHLVSMMPQVATISMTHFLHPTAMTSHSILLLLFNLMVFHEDKLRDIAPCEEELFERSEQVHRLAEQKHKLQELLNEQAQEKALRAERVEKLEWSIKQLEEEGKAEAAANHAEQAARDEALAGARRAGALLDQRRAARDAARADADKKRALRVYDADDVRAQAAQATRGVQELEERSGGARATLLHKEAGLRTLQALRPALDAANALLHDILQLSEALTDLECGDLESDSQEGELDVLQTELGELQAAARELAAARRDERARRAAGLERRARARAATDSALREASEKFRKNTERSSLAAERTEEIKQLTLQYEEERTRGMREIDDIHNSLEERLQSCQEKLMNQMVDLVKKVENYKSKNKT